VENVSWEECQEYIKWLNQKEKTPGWEYRLPSDVAKLATSKIGKGREAKVRTWLCLPFSWVIT